MNNLTVQEVEQDLIAYRARNLLKQPVHAGETMAEYRERKAHRLRLYKALALAFAVLLLVAVAMWAGVMR